MDFLTPACATRSLGPANTLINTFLSTMIAIHCNISTTQTWPKDYGEHALAYGLDDYDYVIIGAGSAGSVVAGRLAENIDSKILLIEAGGNTFIENEIPGLAFSTFGSEVDWNYPTRSNNNHCLGMKDETCIWNKGKLLGGSHSINAMLYLRGNPRDYQDWVNEGNPAWSWNDIQYYFQKTEKFKGNQSGVHGTYGPMNVEAYRGPKLDEFMFMKAAKELGYNAVEDFSAGPYLGFGRVYGTLKNGRRMTTAKAFLTPKRPNLHIIKHAVARKIKFTRKLKAETVSFVYKGRYQMEVKARKEIILCAGSIETPKLLMLSGLGPRIHLKALGLPFIKNLPVGNNLQDHVRVDLFFKLKIKQTLGMDSEFLDSVYSQWVYRNGPYGKPGLDITGFINTDGVGLYPDIQLILSRIDNITAFQPNWKPYILKSFENQIHPPDTIFFISVILLRPRSRGLVRLQSLDYRHNPFILPNYFQDADDMRRLVRGIHKVLEFPNTPILKDFDAEFLRPNLPKCDEHEYQSTRYWKCYSRYMTNTVWHPCGTAKMGPRNSKSAVVDSELRVHGMKGLRIIDASVMPNLVSSNINAAVIMIGEKGADLVKIDRTI